MNQESQDDVDDLRALASALAPLELAPARAEQIRRRIHAFAPRPRRVWRRVEPLAVGALAASYVAWAMQMVWSIAR